MYVYCSIRLYSILLFVLRLLTPDPLRTLSCLLLTNLLALDHSGISRQISQPFHRRAVVGIVPFQGPGKTVADGTGLSAQSSSLHLHPHVEDMDVEQLKNEIEDNTTCISRSRKGWEPDPGGALTDAKGGTWPPPTQTPHVRT